MKRLVLMLSLGLSACAHKRVALAPMPQLPHGNVLLWGRIIPVVDGKENYKNCKVEIESSSIPLDSNGVFFLSTKEDNLRVRSVTCGEKSVVLPTNYVKIQKNAGPRSIYLGSIFIKFGNRSYTTKSSDYANKYNTEYMMEANDAEYFAVQNHYVRDRALFGRLGNTTFAYKATRSILETPGIPKAKDNNQISDREPASLSDDQNTPNKKTKNLYNNVDGYRYDYWTADEAYKSSSNNNAIK